MDFGAVTAWLGQVSAMSTTLKASLGGAVALAATTVVAVLVKRIGKPVIVTVPGSAAEPPRGVCARLFARGKKIFDALDYLATRREWRYRQPWMLLLGEQGAGKTSLVGSISLTWRHGPPARAGELSAAGTQWAYLRHGVLIDADGQLSAAAEGSDEAAQWKKTLSALNGLRPERPLDGILLCVSARSLREASSAQRERMAESISRQLSQLQASIEFILPVYVIVTQCDSITGFGAFWLSQPSSRLSEMFGYSAMPQDQSQQPSDWAKTAFELLGERLRALQVDVAAHNKHVEDVDNFFLFPGHFATLREPLAQWLEVVFKATVWQSGYLFRGLYFTGAVDANGMPASAARSDISFVDALVAEKALREPNLARPTRPGIWSRNRLIRAMQIAGLILFAILLTALVASSIQFSHQVDTLVSAMNTLEKAMPSDTNESGCLTQDSVYPLLKDVALVDTHTTYWVVPASWIDGRIASNSAERIGHTTVGRVLMPALACHLEVHARHLIASVADIAPPGVDLASRRASLEKLVADVRTFEDNLARFDTLAQKSEQLKEKDLLAMLAELATYCFGAPTPPELQRPGGILDDAFDHVKYDKEPVLPTGMRTRLARQIGEQGSAVSLALDQEVSLGDDLLASLSKGQPPILENTRRFANWLSWARQSWLSSTVERNPCAEIVASIKPNLQALTAQYGYARELGATLTQFDATQCYKPEMLALASMQLSPYGPMFAPKSGGLELTPALQGELAGLPSLVSLGFMRLQKTRSFVCAGSDAVWHSNEVAEAANYLREYEAFVKQQKLSALPAGGQPLYDKLARLSLERAINDAMYRAQQLPDSASWQLVSLAPVSRADEQLAATGNELSHALPSLQRVLKAYSDYGFSSSGAVVRQCLGDFAADNLGHVSALAAASRLYAPQAASSGNAMFDTGNLPVLKDYLARQFARAQVLVGYASPFLSVLQTGPGINAAQRDSTQTATYWSNTTSELNRYAQAKEPSGQVADLENYFIKQLSGLTYSNCSKVLASYTSPEAGIDLFSERRTQLEELVDVRCADRKQAQALEAFQALASRFNRDLAGRYPFGDLGARDASLATVKAFFMDYDAQRAALQEALADVPARDWKAQLNFIAQLDAISGFLRSNLDSSDVSDAVKLNAAFRAQVKSSPGSEQIVSWLLTAGASSAGFPNRATTMEWSFGQPLVLDLTWADRSQWTPQADATQRDLIVDGKQASFAMMGSWSLLRMIDAHRPTAAIARDALNARQILLEFRVPTVGPNAPDGKPSQSQARLYLGLTLGGTDAKTQAATTLKLPAVFPHSAPSDKE